MPANALVTTRVDESVKKKASDVLEQMGLTVSDAVRLLLIKVAKEETLPFSLYEPNAETLQAMKEAKSRQLERFDSVDDLMKDLHAKD